MFKFLKTLLTWTVAGILILAAGAFYLGMRWSEKLNECGDEPAKAVPPPTETQVLAKKETPELARPQKKTSSDVQARAVLFELLAKKKTAERRLKNARTELTRLENAGVSEERLESAREAIASLEREIKNCEDAIAVAKATSAERRDQVNREREDANKILKKLN